MANSYGAGCMAVFVASGTVVLLALRVHKHLMSDFMNKIDAEMGTTAAGRDNQERRKVKFAGDDHHLQPSAAGKNRAVVGGETLESMPPNWQVLYKGIIQYNKASLRRLN
nr:TRNA (guanine-N(1)-)-methyltransferase [Ipomoea batatas]